MLTMSLELVKVGYSIKGRIICTGCAEKNAKSVADSMKNHTADQLYKSDLKGFTVCEGCGLVMGV